MAEVGGIVGAWEREVAAEIRRVVGDGPATIVLHADGAPVWGSLDGTTLGAGRLRPPSVSPMAAGKLPLADGSQAVVVASFVGADLVPAARQGMLVEIGRALAPAGRVLVVDHNRPRRRPAAWAAVLSDPRPPGTSLGARWQRLAYPTARELQNGNGIVVEAVRLAAGERVQVVIGRRP